MLTSFMYAIAIQFDAKATQSWSMWGGKKNGITHTLTLPLCQINSNHMFLKLLMAVNDCTSVSIPGEQRRCQRP